MGFWKDFWDDNSFVRGTRMSVNKEIQNECYGAAVKYFDCLTLNHENDSLCEKEHEVFSNLCPYLTYKNLLKQRSFARAASPSDNKAKYEQYMKIDFEAYRNK